MKEKKRLERVERKGRIFEVLMFCFVLFCFVIHIPLSLPLNFSIFQESTLSLSLNISLFHDSSLNLPLYFSLFQVEDSLVLRIRRAVHSLRPFREAKGATKLPRWGRIAVTTFCASLFYTIHLDPRPPTFSFIY